MAERKIAKCKTIPTAQALVKFLKDKTQAWNPPVYFDMLLRSDGVEIVPSPGSPLREVDRKEISAWVKEFITTVS